MSLRDNLEERIREIARKPVIELTEEEKQLLREWMEKHRSQWAIKMDALKGGKIPYWVGTWLRKPNRYDIPGVDTPQAAPRVD